MNRKNVERDSSVSIQHYENVVICAIQYRRHRLIIRRRMRNSFWSSRACLAWPSVAGRGSCSATTTSRASARSPTAEAPCTSRTRTTAAPTVSVLQASPGNSSAAQRRSMTRTFTCATGRIWSTAASAPSSSWRGSHASVGTGLALPLWTADIKVIHVFR
nr:uncharacterized protein LOC113800117 isoform X1 [Penaeus vannamei]